MKFDPSSRILPRAAASLAITLFAIVCLPAVAASDADYRLKAGARGTLCLDCHDSFQEVLNRKHVHSPVKAGECADCHDPHASDHGKLLASDPSTICLECHASVVPESYESVHGAVVEGNCASCHDPHGSDSPAALLRPGNQLCAGCHDDVVRATTDSRFGHPPARSDCLSCHDPHVSGAADSLLVASEPQICLDCHDSSGSTFRDRHRGYPVDRGKCSSCHAPHGSDTGALLWDNVHPPVAGRMCEQCHVGADAVDPLATKRAGLDLCRGCHNTEVNAATTGARPHWPAIVGRACGNCHDPHASPRGSLLTSDQSTLCQSCHQDVARRLARSSSTHQPVVDGECSTCHDPHGSDQDLLLTADTEFELCSSCHDWKVHSMHPLGEDAVDFRNPNLRIDCNSCHRTHGTEFDHLAPFQSDAALCVECHDAYRR